MIFTHFHLFKPFACPLIYLIKKLILFNITTLGVYFVSIAIHVHILFKELIFKTINFKNIFFLKTNTFNSYYMYDVNVNRHLFVIKESVS